MKLCQMLLSWCRFARLVLVGLLLGLVVIYATSCVQFQELVEREKDWANKESLKQLGQTLAALSLAEVSRIAGEAAKGEYEFTKKRLGEDAEAFGKLVLAVGLSEAVRIRQEALEERQKVLAAVEPAPTQVPTPVETASK